MWGRGAVDMLNQTAAMALAFARLAASPQRLRGTLVFAAVADEETGGDHGVVDILARRPELLAADVALTEAGGTVTPTPAGPGDRRDVRREGDGADAHRRAGRAAHGSTPRAGDNALVTAAEVVRRIDRARPATHISDDWRHWVEATVTDEELRHRLLDVEHLWDDLDHLPDDVRVHAHACTHTTYTPTVVHAGTVRNIVPDRVELEVDVRVVPAESSHDVERFLHDLLDDLPVTITVIARTEPSSSPMTEPIWPALERAVRRAHPGGRLRRRCSPAAPTAATCAAPASRRSASASSAPGSTRRPTGRASTATTSASTSTRSACPPPRGSTSPPTSSADPAGPLWVREHDRCGAVRSPRTCGHPMR